MFLRRENFKIFKAVISFNAINMVNKLICFKRSSKMLTHNKSTSFNSTILTRIGMSWFSNTNVFHNYYNNTGRDKCQRVGGPI